MYRRAVKMIMFESKIPTDDKFKSLKILPIRNQHELNKGLLMYDIVHKKAPRYLQILINQPTRNQDDSRKPLLPLPLPRIDLYKSSLSFSGPSVWNTLPDYLKILKSRTLFKQKLKSFMMNN